MVKQKLIISFILLISVFLGIALAEVNQRPVSDCGGPYEIYAGNDLELDGTGSYDPDGSIVDYLWEIDYNQTASWAWNDAEGEEVTFTWASILEEGLYSAGAVGYDMQMGLRCIDNLGLGKNDKSTFKILNNSPVAASGGPYTIATGADLVLDGSASSDKGGAITDYGWDLDGGGVYDDASGASPTVEWATLVTLGQSAAGLHVLTLQVTDNNNVGATNTDTSSFTIDASPTAALSASLDSKLIETWRYRYLQHWSLVVADARDSTDDIEITKYEYDWGDGSSNTVETPGDGKASHYYYGYGTYTVGVEVTDASEQTDEATDTITIIDFFRTPRR